MKKEQLYEALGDIDENYVSGAKKVENKRPHSVWMKWGAVAACLCLVIVSAFILNPILVPERVEGPYSITHAYVGWSDSQMIYDGAINKELLGSEPDEHFPIFRLDTPEELERFKTQYENVFNMDQEYDNVLSFNGAIKKAQWDREGFYEDNSLLIVYVPANSGSLRFHVKEIITKDSSLCIVVECENNSDVATDDMAGWTILVGIEKEELQKYTSFDAVLDD